MLSHIISLGAIYANPPVIPRHEDSCLLTFPNYVTGFLMGVKCELADYKYVEGLLKLAHAERFYKAPPPQVVSEKIAAQLLRISLSTLRGWVAKGWIYRWYAGSCGYVFSHAEVQALRSARPRSL